LINYVYKSTAKMSLELLIVWSNNIYPNSTISRKIKPWTQFHNI